MKKVLFLLVVLFAFTTVATAETTTFAPPKGYNYQKAKKKAARHNFFHRPHNKNGGCGWHKATR